MKIAILISGSGSNMVALVEAMKARRVSADPVLVLANQPDAKGIAKAQAMDVKTAVVPHRDFDDKAGFEAALHEALVEAQAELVCLAGFMRVLSAEFVDAWKGRILNIHPSLLPSFKGLNTHARALDAGCAVHGASVHVVTPQLDAGRIVGQAAVPVLPGDTADDLAARVLVQEHQLYPAALAHFLSGDTSPLLLSTGLDFSDENA